MAFCVNSSKMHAKPDFSYINNVANKLRKIVRNVKKNFTFYQIYLYLRLTNKVIKDNNNIFFLLIVDRKPVLPDNKVQNRMTPSLITKQYKDRPFKVKMSVYPLMRAYKDTLYIISRYH